MAYRRRMRRSRSRRVFRRGARTNKKNGRGKPMRGGIRL